ncbi:MAG: T9SS type A sorting domain-containing protein [Bacteroidetes bacterium]|nr:T9SS type A sorting domain-containing protein [Bacteroidota bacterium]
MVILLIYSQLPAQTVWYFGDHASLDFTSGTAVSVANGQAINTGEGCTEAYDDNCNLLFYSDGSIVWNRLNNIIPNGTGLDGSPTSTQSAIAVPIPTFNFDKFYLFTVDDGSSLFGSGHHGLRYNLVENCLTSPVINSTIKNIALEPFQTCEKLTVTSDHSGGYWILAHGFEVFGNSKGCSFYAYHLQNDGTLVTIPVISVIGNNIYSTLADAQGQMKFSHDGSMVAISIHWERIVDLLDFSVITGQLSNPRRIIFPYNVGGDMDCQIYGLEFSPSNQFLYISGSYTASGVAVTKRIYQVDLSTFIFQNTSTNSICGSIPINETVFTSFSDISAYTGIRILYTSPSMYNYEFGQLQMAPDGNIYIPRRHLTNLSLSNYVSRIESPDMPGAVFNEKAVQLLSGQACVYGLPTLIQDQKNCLLPTLCGYKFNDLNGNGVWDNGEPTIPGWKITLSGLIFPSKSTYTDATGRYCFKDVPITWVNLTEELPADWNCTKPGGAPYYFMNLIPNVSYEDINFGNYKCVVPPVSMVAWWPMDETTGTTAKDIVGYNNMGTYQGATRQQPGKVKGGLMFWHNFSDYVLVPDQLEINFGTGNFSIDTWIRFRSFPDYIKINAIIVKKLNPTGDLGYSFYVKDDFLGLRVADGNSTADYLSDIQFTTDAPWSHVAVTVDRNDPAGVIFYLDGVPHPYGNTVIPPGLITNTDALILGGANALYHGFELLDEVEMFCNVLSPEDVDAIYQSGADGKCKPPVVLTVTSVYPNSGVPIEINIQDVTYHLSDGVTDASNPLKREYYPGTTVQLTAEYFLGGTRYFYQWKKNGAFFSWSKVISPTITEDVTYTAVYLDFVTPYPGIKFQCYKSCPGYVHTDLIALHLDSLASLSFTFTIDTTKLHFIEYQDLNIDTTQGAFYMNALGNTVFGAWFSLIPVNIDSGRIVTLVFEAREGAHTITWSDDDPALCQATNFAENIIPVVFENGALDVTLCSSLRGKLTYDNATATPIGNSLVKLLENGIEVKQVSTDAGGNYLFPDVFAGNYTLDGDTGLPWGGVNATDAQLILKQFVHLIQLSPLRLEAADVNKAYGINSNDALSATKRFVGLISHFVIPDWVFEHPVVSIGGTADIIKDFKGICAGDVNGSNTLGARLNPTVSIGNEDVMPIVGEEVEIPVRVSSGMKAGAISLVINLSGGCLSVKDVRMSGEGSLEFNQTGDELRIAWFTMDPLILNPGDVLLILSCHINSGSVNNLSCRWNLGAESSFSDGDAQQIDNVYLTYPSLLKDPKEVYLGQNMPNPFNHSTEIPYYLPEDGKVTINVFDMLGKVVMNLADELQNSGTHQVRIGENNLRPGVYTYQLEFHNNNLQTCKSLKMLVK